VPIGLFAGSVGVNGAALTSLLLVTASEPHTMMTAIAAQIAASTYRDFCNRHPALRYTKVVPISATIHTTKPLANGAANRWQGYVAREGLGTTRIKNQISDINPMIGSSHISQGYFLLHATTPPVLVPLYEQLLLSCV